MISGRFQPPGRVGCLIPLLLAVLPPGLALAQPEAASSQVRPSRQTAADPQAGAGGEGGRSGGGVSDILNLDIEQLAKTPVVVPSMDIPVTSVAKQESTVGRSPAAVFVITNEMIRRSGATCIPEALRMAPAKTLRAGRGRSEPPGCLPLGVRPDGGESERATDGGAARRLRDADVAALRRAPGVGRPQSAAPAGGATRATDG